MQELILDTDTVSEILRGVNPVVEAHKNACTAHFQRLTFTSFTAFEILSGLRKKDAKAQLQRAQGYLLKISRSCRTWRTSALPPTLWATCSRMDT